MAGLGALFLLAGILTREAGWIIPGGIVSGIGWGIVLIAGPRQLVEGDAEGGLFMLAFAAGWASITLLTAIFTDETHWWALIPAAILALIGTAVLTGGIFMDILELAGKLWPLVLITIGIAILIGASKSRNGQEKPS